MASTKPVEDQTAENLHLRISVLHLVSLAVLCVFLSIARASRKWMPTNKRSQDITNQLKAHLLYAPIFKHRRARELEILGLSFGSLPTRLQALSIATIAGINLFLLLYRQPVAKPGVPLLGTLVGRSGSLAVANFIPLTVLASVHNPLIWSLDVSQVTFNTFHRWFGRITITEPIIHAACHAASVRSRLDAEQLRKHVEKTFFVCGLTAALCFIMILMSSVKPIRSAAYETFHYVHMSLVLVAFVMLCLHLEERRQKWFVIVAIISWGVLRISRLLITVYRSIGTTVCTAVVDALTNDVVRVSVSPTRPWKFRSGQSLYLSIPRLGLISAHPFSIFWSDESHLSPVSNTQREDASPTEKTPAEAALDDANKTGSTVMYCLIKAQGGSTKHLWREAWDRRGTTEGELPLKGVVAGPYGRHHNFARYDCVLLVAGGIGITHIFPVIHSLARQRCDGGIAPRKVRLVWVARTINVLEWFNPWHQQINELQAQTGDMLRLELYVTRPSFVVNSTTTAFMVQSHRPSVDLLVSDWARCCNLNDKKCISVCGAGSLSDDVRDGARRALRNGISLDLREEAFGW